MAPSSRPKVLVVGDLLLDTWLWGRCDRISPEAPVQIVDVQRRSSGLGGAGNVVANLASLGAEVELFTVVGDDSPGDMLKELLGAQESVSWELLCQKGRATPEKTRVIATNQQVLRYDLEARDPIPPELENRLIESASRTLRRAHVVILSDYGKGVVTERVCQTLIQRARALGKPVLCDPKGRDFSKYRGAFAVTPNRKEASLAAGLEISDADSLRLAGDKLLRENGLRHLVITLGSDGMALFGDGEVDHIGAEACEVFDVSGAGDTVIAAIARGLADGASMAQACRLANTAAGIVVGRFGTASVTLDEVRRRGREWAQQAARSKGAPTDVDTLCELLEPGRKVVFTNGCFDILHAGHVQLLEQCAAMGDVVVVGLNSDASVARLKGEGRPIQSVERRARVLAALEAVDHVVVFEEDTPFELIRRIQPQVLVKGGDYRIDEVVGADLVRAAGGEVRIITLAGELSTSELIRRIVEVGV